MKPRRDRVLARLNRIAIGTWPRLGELIEQVREDRIVRWQPHRIIAQRGTAPASKYATR